MGRPKFSGGGWGNGLKGDPRKNQTNETDKYHGIDSTLYSRGDFIAAIAGKYAAK